MNNNTFSKNSFQFIDSEKDDLLDQEKIEKNADFIIPKMKPKWRRHFLRLQKKKRLTLE